MINTEYSIVAIVVGVGWDVWKRHGGSLILIKLFLKLGDEYLSVWGFYSLYFICIFYTLCIFFCMNEMFHDKNKSKETLLALNSMSPRHTGQGFLVETAKAE